MEQAPLLKGSAASRAIHHHLGDLLRSQGFVRARGATAYSRALRDDVLFVLDVSRLAKLSYPGVAQCLAMDVGLGIAPVPADPTKTAMRHLAFCLRGGSLASEMCMTHNRIVNTWRTMGPEASRVATLLDWTVRDDWRNAPEVLWFRTEADLMAWAVFLRRALPAALGWLSRAHLDRSHLALRLWFDEL